MKKSILSVIVCTAAAPVVIFLLSWGTWGHQHINNAAVFALPDSMRHFFYNHIDFITEESVIPDVRKYAISDKQEFARHYIDLENFRSNGSDTVPQRMKEAVAKYDSKFLDKNGILPWYLIELTQKLTKAFQDKKKAEILFLAADLAHYLGDATMPLHTAVNHDGQLSRQQGIHSFFESQLPEQFGSTYNLYTGNAVYIKDIQQEVWRIITASHLLVDPLLRAEKTARQGFDTTRMYVKDSKGKVVRNKYNQWIHSYEYAKAFHDALNGMVAQQLRVAVGASANFWYTAWINAGSPDLDGLDQPALTKRNSKHYKTDYKRWKKGELFGFKVDAEF
ncbi:MAG: zinc dependent phospholipase C family protein [Chitinophagaceae bacterium]